MLPHLHGYLISVHSCLRGSSQLLASYGNQDGSLGSGVLDGRSHKPVDKLLHDDLAGECLGDFNHRREVELFDRCVDRAGWTWRALVLPQPRMELVELPHLSLSSPTLITGSRLPQISVGDRLETAGRVETSRKLVADRLVLDKAVRSCSPDGTLVKIRGIERTRIDPGNPGPDQ